MPMHRMAHERQLYEEGKIDYPSVYKVNIQDVSHLRLELEQTLGKLPQKRLSSLGKKECRSF